MEDPTQQAFTQSRQSLKSFSGFPNSQAQQIAVPFASLDPHLRDLDSSGEAFAQHFRSQLADPSHGQHLHPGDPFNGNIVSRFQDVRSHATPPQPGQNRSTGLAGQFGVLTPHPQFPRNVQTPRNAYLHYDALDRIQRDYPELQSAPAADGSKKKDGHFANAKSIPNPPNLLNWRERLFHVDETITLSEDEYAICNFAPYKY